VLLLVEDVDHWPSFFPVASIVWPLTRLSESSSITAEPVTFVRLAVGFDANPTVFGPIPLPASFDFAAFNFQCRVVPFITCG
jgi:hypothetical protein